MTMKASEGRMFGARRLIISARSWHRVWSILLRSVIIFIFRLSRCELGSRQQNRRNRIRHSKNNMTIWHCLWGVSISAECTETVSWLDKISEYCSFWIKELSSSSNSSNSSYLNSWRKRARTARFLATFL